MSSVRRLSMPARFLLWLAVSLPVAVPAMGDVRLPHVISANMVVQRDVPVHIWGWAAPGEEVSITLKDGQARAKADENGRWSVKLPAMPAGGPHELVVAGQNEIRVKNVLVGEVWVCSGQSNMAWPVSRADNAQEEIAAAKFPEIRLLAMSQKLAGEPADDADVKWEPCSPQTVGTFSAVAYFFGRELHRKLDVPVGLINTSWGGTSIEPWTPLGGFAANPKLAEYKEQIEKARRQYAEVMRQYLDGVDAWTAGSRKALAEGKPVTSMPAWPAHPLLTSDGRRAPSAMYNAMVSPFTPLAIRGAIWYQGEANVLSNDGIIYHEKMKALIGGWRAAWGLGDFPFYYVQLAPWQYHAKYPAGSKVDRLPRIWEAQFATLAVPNTGMAVTTDIGNVRDIHPTNKQEVGRRLALWALARTYGQKDLVISGPLYKSMAVEGKAIRVRFDHADGGLASRDGKPLTWFQVAGEDRKFVDAKAEIDGDSLLVSSDTVARPVAVRFGWHEEAEPNLINKAGLPASPFRTDSW